MIARPLVGCVALLALPLAAVPVAAQITVTPSVFVAYVQHQVDIGYGDEQTSGPVLGATVSVAPTRWTDVTLSGYTGTLNADSAIVDSRRMADLELGEHLCDVHAGVADRVARAELYDDTGSATLALGQCRRRVRS